MAKAIPSVGALRRKCEVTDEEIDAAVDAYVENLKVIPFCFASGHEIDVAAAAEADLAAKVTVGDPDRSAKFRHNMVRTAVLMAQSAMGRGVVDHANSNSELRKAEVQRMMRRLIGFARGLGLDEATIRRIVRQVAADMPSRMDDERLVEARLRMVAAAMA
ncbi:hypothetical protein [Methylobacterium sp. E-046]|uniref:hypothetical protein n=1 Tax=Methylobacterium sp. E-046 TaxID=2836576 RepID=UPI001FBA1E90|nr:hypothetical protein [Methylobacterium sp. E-046]MCJ2101040.1 hypothetical protein [Methylobacterium sp. E-046]